MLCVWLLPHQLFPRGTVQRGSRFHHKQSRAPVTPLTLWLGLQAQQKRNADNLIMTLVHSVTEVRFPSQGWSGSSGVSVTAAEARAGDQAGEHSICLEGQTKGGGSHHLLPWRLRSGVISLKTLFFIQSRPNHPGGIQ